MIIFGITGGSGAGKTTALNALGGMGAEILDADEIYHELTLKSESMHRELTARYGDIWLPDGSLDRKALGVLVYRDEDAMEALNRITHKYVDHEMRRRLSRARLSGKKLAAIDAILLIESGLGRHCDYCVAVTAPEEVRVRRIMARDGITEEYARARIAAQQSDEFYRKHCNYVLVNSGEDPARFQQEARDLFAELINR